MRVVGVIAALCSAGLSCVSSASPATLPYSYRPSDRMRGPFAWPGQCAEGKRQSPVNVVDAEEAGQTLTALVWRYQPIPIRVRHDGTAYEFSVPQGSSTLVDPLGRRLTLERAVLRSPGEHRIRGIVFPMELQLFHRAEDGSVVAVSQLFTEGRRSAALAKVLDADLRPLPEKVSAGPSQRPLELRGRFVNFEDLLARRRHYFQYKGSQTVPPCKEGVTWYVMGDYSTVAGDQVNYLRSAMASTIGAKFADYVGNARPVQNWNGRKVRASAVPPVPSKYDELAIRTTKDGSSSSSSASTSSSSSSAASSESASERMAAAAVKERQAIIRDAAKVAGSGKEKGGKSAEQVLADARANLQKAAEVARAKAKAEQAAKHNK